MNMEQDATGMMRLVGQVFMIPIAAFMYGVEMFLNTMQAMQAISTQGMGTLVAPPALVNQPTEVRAVPDTKTVDFTISNSSSGRSGRTEEEKVLNYNTQSGGCGLDKNLNDEMLKLVRYKILFIKRDYEWAFPEQEALVHDSMDGAAFTAWKVAEFIQQLERPRTYGVNPVRVPPDWKGYPGPRYIRIVNGVPYLTGFPPDDKKYLRVYYEVLERYTREKFRYEEEQIDVLKEIRDCICVERPRPDQEPRAETEESRYEFAAVAPPPPTRPAPAEPRSKG